MKKIFTLNLNHMLKKSVVSATLLSIVFFALASSGGGKKKSSSTLGVVPVSSKSILSLKSRPSYSGSSFLTTTNTKNTTIIRSVVTYQKGNTTYVIPSQYKVNNSKFCFTPAKLSFRSNLNVVDLKIRLCK